MAYLPQLLSGARGAIEFTDASGVTTTLAIATDISVNVRNDIRPTFVVGHLNAVALDPMGIDVDCSIGRIIPVTKLPDTPVAENAASQPALDKITAIDHRFELKIDEILKSDSLMIVIKDTQTGQTIAKVVGARFAGRSTSLSTGDIGSERYQFVGIYDGASGNTATMSGSSTTGYGPGVES